MRRLLCAALILASPFPAASQEDARAERIHRTWSQWVAESGVSAATLAVMRSGEVVLADGTTVPADTAMPLASLSKAVTAACVAALIDQKELAFGLRPGDVLDAAGSGAGRTVAELLTHTSGIWPDGTQNNERLRGPDPATIADVAEAAISRSSQQGKVGSYAYNNENYAILGAMIEAVTGEPYGEACAARLFEPLGIESAALAGEWAPHGSWGGWSASAADFARFAWATFGPRSAIGRGPEGWPAAEAGGGANYGMGVLWHQMRGRTLFWHAGLLCWNGKGNGAYFASYGGEWLVVTLYEGCLKGTDRLAKLDEALFHAALR